MFSPRAYSRLGQFLSPYLPLSQPEVSQDFLPSHMRHSSSLLPYFRDLTFWSSFMQSFSQNLALPRASWMKRRNHWPIRIPGSISRFLTCAHAAHPQHGCHQFCLHSLLLGKVSNHSWGVPNQWAAADLEAIALEPKGNSLPRNRGLILPSLLYHLCALNLCFPSWFPEPESSQNFFQ